ncbi:MAG TPA: putative glycolipid-binding domain-containing protein [Methanosarcina sp.]|nr:putative glycolipid-binding domain-containing protein [Methanosarcina sp.]
MNKARTIVWQALAWQSTVVHTHKVNEDIRGHGFAIGKTDGNIPFAMDYDLALTADWNIKEMSVKSLLDERAIRLVHEGDQWYDGKGQYLPEFDGIEFVDISISPFTNTLPIKRLQFEGEQAQKVDIIYFDENKFTLQKVQQIYSHLGERTYCYQDIELPDFVSNITVDEDGLVIDFPKMFRRV